MGKKKPAGTHKDPRGGNWWKKRQVWVTCPTCYGSGKRGIRNCGLCNGSGKILVLEE